MNIQFRDIKYLIKDCRIHIFNSDDECIDIIDADDTHITEHDHLYIERIESWEYPDLAITTYE